MPDSESFDITVKHFKFPKGCRIVWRGPGRGMAVQTTWDDRVRRAFGRITANPTIKAERQRERENYIVK